MTELLAPVPLVHLESLQAAGRTVAVFGTRALETFERLERDGGIDTPVIIYASHTEGTFVPAATWVARYESWAACVGNGLVPKAWRHDRPPTTNEEDRSAGYWYGYYRVTDLRRLEPGEFVGFGVLRSDTTGKRLADNFVPEGPILVHRMGDR